MTASTWFYRLEEVVVLRLTSRWELKNLSTNCEDIQLSYDSYPFFEGAASTVNECEGFYNNVMSTEGNIFEGCKITWMLFKKALLVQLSDAAFVREWQTTSHILTEVISKVIDTVEAVEFVS